MYYYKNKNSNVYYSRKRPRNNLGNFIEISKSEFEKLKPNNSNSEILSKIKKIKQNLANTDYQAIKYAEGQLTAEEYAPMKAQRQAWRDEINQLENTLE